CSNVRAWSNRKHIVRQNGLIMLFRTPIFHACATKPHRREKTLLISNHLRGSAKDFSAPRRVFQNYCNVNSLIQTRLPQSLTANAIFPVPLACTWEDHAQILLAKPPK